MDLIHHLHTGLGTAAGLVQLILESISVLCVALGLEFQFGADIVATTVNPSLQALGEQAAEAGLAKKMRELVATAEGRGL